MKRAIAIANFMQIWFIITIVLYCIAKQAGVLNYFIIKCVSCVLFDCCDDEDRSKSMNNGDLDNNSYYYC